VVRSASPIAAFARSRNVQVIIACVAIGVVLSETAARSRSREGERPPPSVAVDRLPPPAIKAASIKTASLSLQASSRDSTAAGQPRMESSCKSFEFSFLNPSCSGRRNHHAARRKHRVATFIMGDSDASQSLERAGHLHTHHSQRTSKELLPKKSPMQETRQNRGLMLAGLGLEKPGTVR
jgi:hypothetical protein